MSFGQSCWWYHRPWNTLVCIIKLVVRVVKGEGGIIGFLVRELESNMVTSCYQHHNNSYCIGRSQSLFYFVSHDSHSQAGSARWVVEQFKVWLVGLVGTRCQLNRKTAIVFLLLWTSFTENTLELVSFFALIPLTICTLGSLCSNRCLCFK